MHWLKLHREGREALVSIENIAMVRRRPDCDLVRIWLTGSGDYHDFDETYEYVAAKLTNRNNSTKKLT